MMISKLPIMLCIMSFFFLFGSSLLSIGLALLLIALSISIIMCMMSLPWVSMAFFIVYVGGIMVIFSYFASLSGFAKVGVNSFVLPLFIMLILLMDSNSVTTYLSVPSMMYYSFIYLMLISLIALLVAMIAVVCISHPQGGPLRGNQYAY